MAQPPMYGLLSFGTHVAPPPGVDPWPPRARRRGRDPTRPPRGPRRCAGPAAAGPSQDRRGGITNREAYV